MQYVFTTADGVAKTLTQKEAEQLLVKSGCCGDAASAKAELSKNRAITVPDKDADAGGTLAPGS